jgi:DNA adenine methylase
MTASLDAKKFIMPLFDSLDPEMDAPPPVSEIEQPPVVSATPPRRVARSRGKNQLLQPFLKWAGGKRQLLPEIRKQIPAKFNRYYEPFIGGGAVLFDLQPKNGFINDFNEELANCYKVIKEKPDELLEHIKTHRNTEEYFYQLRGLDRQPEYENLTDVQRASRIIFLNKTCFNGLFRVNSRGQFNVPFGNYQNPSIADSVVVHAVSKYLNDNTIKITTGDFADAVKTAKKDDFVYFDPPYDPVSDTASFTGYSLDKFDRKEQERLKEVVDDLTRRKVKVLLSNSATDFIKKLYEHDYYVIDVIYANRNINSVGTSRGKVSEVLIRNKYDVRENDNKQLSLCPSKTP